MLRLDPKFKFSIVNCQFSIESSAFSLIELMVVIAMIAVLTAGAIPSFSGFTRSQSLFQSFKTLKSDLRVAQARSLSGSAVSGGIGKAWGIHFPPTPSSAYTVFTCTPVSSLSQYSRYTFLACGGSYKTVNLGANVKFDFLNPSNASGLDIVFDSQNGSTVANGAPSSSVTIRLDYASGGGSPLTLTITAAGGIID